MDVEEIREGVLAILKELHEDIDFEAEDKMVEDKILDLIVLIKKHGIFVVVKNLMLILQRKILLLKISILLTALPI